MTSIPCSLGYWLITEGTCSALASALRTAQCQLKDLDLRDNDLRDSGVKELSAALEDPHCKLERLGLSGCWVTEVGCAALAEALQSNTSRLRELDLSYNHPGDSGVKLLSAVLEDKKCKLQKLNVDHIGKDRDKPGLLKYACDLTLNQETAHRRLALSEENRKVTVMRQEQPCPDNPERFDYWSQVLCREELTGRCYWEAEWSGKWVSVGVAYKEISRKGWSQGPLGSNNKSWSFNCSDQFYSVCHKESRADIPVTLSSSRIGVYLDCPAGTLSFYSISPDTPILLHTVFTTFTEPLYPGFWVWGPDSTVSLCQIE
ncbi:stonustoxin subunit beta-like [Lepisosteus oculatus]|uniref:stonustoxin subunit beta-like n=1 Tax=Lepisosteus oculatus TaxID=7918 RepID=UPI0035F52CA5